MKKAVCAALALVLALALVGCVNQYYSFKGETKSNPNVSSPSEKQPQSLNLAATGDHFSMDIYEFTEFYNSFASSPIKSFEKSEDDGYVFYNSEISDTVKLSIKCDKNAGYVQSIILSTPLSGSGSAWSLLSPSDDLFKHIDADSYYRFSNIFELCEMDNTENGYVSRDVGLEGTAVYVFYSVENESGSLHFCCNAESESPTTSGETEYKVVNTSDYGRDGQKCKAYRVVIDKDATDAQMLEVFFELNKDGYYQHTVWFYGSEQEVEEGPYTIGMIDDAEGYKVVRR